MSATVHALPTANVIRRADLPKLAHQTTPEFDAKGFDFRLSFDTPHPTQPNAFHSMMVEWNDGLSLYFDVMGTAAFMHCVDDMGFHPVDVLREIHAEGGKGWTGVYRVID